MFDILTPILILSSNRRLSPDLLFHLGFSPVSDEEEWNVESPGYIHKIIVIMFWSCWRHVSIPHVWLVRNEKLQDCALLNALVYSV